jgi:pimeloyl-ACP methyl ester carboxylesterase
VGHPGDPKARRWVRGAALAILATCVATCLVACTAQGGEGEETASPRHLIYLHGRIVQDRQSPRPQHPRFGFYELEKIRDTFEDRGFTVSAEIRPESISVSDAADRVVEQVRELLDSGVPAERITVVGASMGAGIALLASTRLQNPDLRFAVLGTCLATNVPYLESREGRAPSGKILAIREASDDVVGPCPRWEEALSPGPSRVVREIVLDTGLSHGFLYRPLPEWVDPVVDWASGP